MLHIFIPRQLYPVALFPRNRGGTARVERFDDSKHHLRPYLLFAEHKTKKSERQRLQLHAFLLPTRSHVFVAYTRRSHQYVNHGDRKAVVRGEYSSPTRDLQSLPLPPLEWPQQRLDYDPYTTRPPPNNCDAAKYNDWIVRKKTSRDPFYGSTSNLQTRLHFFYGNSTGRDDKHKLNTDPPDKHPILSRGGREKYRNIKTHARTPLSTTSARQTEYHIFSHPCSKNCGLGKRRQARQL